MMKKKLALILSFVLLLGLFAGCGRAEPEATDISTENTQPQTTEPTAEPTAEPTVETPAVDETVLQARRDAALAYIRAAASVRWRSDTSFQYYHGTTNNATFNVVAGRLYEGLPYSYGGASLGTFLDRPNVVDEYGIHHITGLGHELLGGTSTSARVGIDCSGTVCRSWQSFGASIVTHSSNAMAPANGFLRVGEYDAPEGGYQNTVADCDGNGSQVMYQAYSQLQQADAVVTYNGSTGHAMFVVGVNVKRDENGQISGDSTCTVIDQNGIMRTRRKYYDETLGEYVYVCLRVDYDYTFAKLYQEGYLPITCKELIQSEPIAEPEITDSVQTPDISNLFTGVIQSNWALDNITVCITDAAGATVQKSLCHPVRRSCYAVSMSQLTTDTETQLVGKIKLNALELGDYHCTVTVRTVAGDVFTVRDFDFKVNTAPTEAPYAPAPEAALIPVNNAVGYTGPIATVTTGGQVVEAKDLQQMLSLVSPTGKSVVKLLTNVHATANITFPYTCTIDLNGFMISAENSGITGNAIMIEKAGSESRHTIVKNGTVDGNSLGIRVNAGSLEVDNITCYSVNAPAIGMYGDDHVEGEVNVIRNSTIYTYHSGAFSWHKNDGAQVGRNMLIEDCTIVVDNKNGFVFRTRNGGSSITLGDNVTIYTRGPEELIEGDVRVTGKALTCMGTVNSIVVADGGVSNVTCWSTAES